MGSAASGSLFRLTPAGRSGSRWWDSFPAPPGAIKWCRASARYRRPSTCARAFMAIYPVRGPGGYQLIGITPVPMYEPEGRLVDLRETRILAKAADRWKVRPVDLDEFNAIRAEVEAGTYRYKIVEQEFRPATYFEDPERYLKRLEEAARA